MLILIDTQRVTACIVNFSFHLQRPSQVTAHETQLSQIIFIKTHMHNNLLPLTPVASQNYNLCQQRHHLELLDETYNMVRQ